MAEITFKITVPHGRGRGNRHDWFFPNGWRNVGPTEQRDRAGKRRGKRVGYFPEWFVLMCNDPDCPGRAVVPVSVLTDFANRADTRAPTPAGPAGDDGGAGRG